MQGVLPAVLESGHGNAAVATGRLTAALGRYRTNPADWAPLSEALAQAYVTTDDRQAKTQLAALAERVRREGLRSP